jgi:hypothetical protein
MTNGAGVLAATHLLMVNHRVAKVTVAVLVTCSYNYFTQSHFVFEEF